MYQIIHEKVLLTHQVFCHEMVVHSVCLGRKREVRCMVSGGWTYLASDGGLAWFDGLNESCVLHHRGNTGIGDGVFDSCFQHWTTTSMDLGEGEQSFIFTYNTGDVGDSGRLRHLHSKVDTTIQCECTCTVRLWGVRGSI